MSLTQDERVALAKVDVLRDLEPIVREMRIDHEAKRELWFPSDLLGAPPGEDPEAHRRAMQKRAEGIPDHARAALALNTLTEEGLPHFHRLLAVHLGDDSHWRHWNNLWTAEEDRHGQVLHDYTRDTRIFEQRRIEEMQFEYLKAGFHPEWDKDPYRVFAYTTVQERATQHSHAATGRKVVDIGRAEGAAQHVGDTIERHAERVRFRAVDNQLDTRRIRQVLGMHRCQHGARLCLRE